LKIVEDGLYSSNNVWRVGKLHGFVKKFLGTFGDAPTSI
jgi:hypothetical protein